MSELSDLLRNAKGDASYEAIAAKARRAGHKLSASAVAKYVRDEQKGQTPDETLAAFAAGFDLDVRDLRQAADRPRGELGPYVPDSRANSLTKNQRDALDRLIVSIVEAERGGVSEQASTTENDRAEGSSANESPGHDRPTGRQMREEFERKPERRDDATATDERGVPPRGQHASPGESG